jgi:hypothetical protein
MNKHMVRIMTAVVGAVLWLTSAVQAQYVPHSIKVSVPFEFTFADKSFPAGEYTLACTPIRVELRDARGQVVASAIHHAVQSSADAVAPKLVFVATDSGRVLTQVWAGDPHQGYELAQAKTVTVLAKQRSNKSVALQGAGGNK